MNVSSAFRNYFAVNASLVVTSAQLAEVVLQPYLDLFLSLQAPLHVAVTVRRRCLKRPDLVLSLSLTVEPHIVVETKPELPQELTTAVSTVSVAAGALNPAIAVQAARSTLSLSMLYCAPDSSGPGPMENPFQMSWGTSATAAYSAATVMNVLFIALLTLLQFIVAKVHSRCRKGTLAQGLRFVRFPSLLVFPVMALLQPTAMSCVVTLIYGDAKFRFMAAVSLTLCCAAPVAAFFYLRRPQFPAVFYADYDAAMREQSGAVVPATAGPPCLKELTAR